MSLRWQVTWKQGLCSVEDAAGNRTLDPGEEPFYAQRVADELNAAEGTPSAGDIDRAVRAAEDHEYMDAAWHVSRQLLTRRLRERFPDIFDEGMGITR